MSTPAGAAVARGRGERPADAHAQRAPDPAPAPAPAVFLDRDGTLVRDFRHGADPAALTLLPGVAPALRRLQAAGYRLVVVTNQAGVARGLFTVDEARAAGRHVAALLGAAGVRLAGYYLAPYHADGVVPRYAVAHPDRKPGPGMLVRAAAAL
ncbi:histidinol-phosphatase, partial [bacterium]